MDTERTRAAVTSFFAAVQQGDVETAVGILSPDIDFELPVDRWNAVIPYLGHHRGRDAVMAAFGIRGDVTETKDYAMLDLVADGDRAVATVYTRAAQTRTRQEFENEDTHRMRVSEEGQIVSWKVYFDPNEQVAAFTVDTPERLVDAAWTGDGATLAELIAQDADLDRPDPASRLTPLMIAAGRGDAATVSQLLAAGASVHVAEAGAGGTALHKACQGGSLDVVRMLVEAGAFVDAVAPTTGHTPLLDAIWFKRPDITGYLLDRGAGLNIPTHYGFTLDQHFAYESNVNVVGQDDMARIEQAYLARRDADERAAGEQRLMAAVVAGDVDGVRSLLVEGVDVDQRYPVVNGFNDFHTPLLVAARDGHVEAVRLLLDAGADVNAVEPTFGAVPLHKAVYNGHPEETRMIASHPGVDLDFQGATNGYTPLHDALWHGYEACARILVEAGARLDLRGHDGKTPLDLAVEAFGADHDLTAAIGAGTKR